VIWLAWRQQRTEALIAALLLALIAAVVVPTGLHIASVYEQEGIAACLAESPDRCREELDAFIGRWDLFVNLTGWFNLVPALLGALVAAPFVLEFERGTFRLAWTQSVTRDRWLTTRLALIAGAAATASLLLALLLTWWRGPLDDVNGRMVESFSLEGVAPIAYTLFAAALVIALGIVLRRTAAAIGLALVVFFVVRIAVENWARPRYVTANDRDLDHRGRTRSPHGAGVQGGERAPGHRRGIARSCGRPVMPHVGQELRCRLPGRARPRRLHARRLPPGEPILALPGHRSGHLHSLHRRSDRLLGLVDPQTDQLTHPPCGKLTSRCRTGGSRDDESQDREP
jgi:ABC-2 family transporter protein